MSARLSTLCPPDRRCLSASAQLHRRRCTSRWSPAPTRETLDGSADRSVDGCWVHGTSVQPVACVAGLTRDFDFVIAAPGQRLERLVGLLYDRGLELASRVDRDGEVTATISNPRVAVTRLRLDAPSGAYFFNAETGLRIDLLFDFPVPASTLAKNAIRTKIRSRVLRVASESDLLSLKKIAREKRSSSRDAEDIAFLEARGAGGSHE
jgi:hypothetical protein